jgi:hypothetical protein
MSFPVIAGIVRHLLTAGGSYLVLDGQVDQSIVDEGIGAIMTIGGLFWSFVDKKKHNS